MWMNIFPVQINILPVCMNVHHMQAWYLQRSEKRVRFLELVLQMVVNHPVGATIALNHESSLQLLFKFLKIYTYLVCKYVCVQACVHCAHHNLQVEVRWKLEGVDSLLLLGAPENKLRLSAFTERGGEGEIRRGKERKRKRRRRERKRERPFLTFLTLFRNFQLQKVTNYKFCFIHLYQWSTTRLSLWLFDSTVLCPHF